MNDRPANTQISCPRCGYDQRGVAATWIDQCPLEGTCTECGLPFFWRELLDPSISLPRWCVERQRSLLVFPLQCAATLVRTFWPWRFWAAISIMHARSWWRIAMYLVFL